MKQPFTCIGLFLFDDAAKDVLVLPGFSKTKRIISIHAILVPFTILF
jgi:hypothetical protein